MILNLLLFADIKNTPIIYSKGNMPKIEYFDTILTSVCSRGIKTILSVPSEHQLDFKYGKEAANVLKSAMQYLQLSAIPYTDLVGV